MISARVHYACLAMLELASRSSEQAPVSLREISDQHGVPGPSWFRFFDPYELRAGYRVCEEVRVDIA